MSLSSLLTDLQQAWPAHPVPPQTLALYARHLDGIPLDVLEGVVHDLVRTETRFPPLATILDRVAERVLHLPSEAEALAQVARMRGGQGYWALHGTVKAALDGVGGFSAWRTTEQPGILRAQFLSLYREMRAAEVRHAVLSGFRGEIEQ